jgi:hypothetical protein
MRRKRIRIQKQHMSEVAEQDAQDLELEVIGRVHGRRVIYVAYDETLCIQVWQHLFAHVLHLIVLGAVAQEDLDRQGTPRAPQHTQRDEQNWDESQTTRGHDSVLGAAGGEEGGEFARREPHLPVLFGEFEFIFCREVEPVGPLLLHQRLPVPVTGRHFGAGYVDGRTLRASGLEVGSKRFPECDVVSLCEGRGDGCSRCRGQSECRVKGVRRIDRVRC